MCQHRARDPRLRVVAAAGVYDLATPYLAQKYALDQMAQELPDVLVLDLSMPRVDGLQVLEEMRRRGGLRPYTIVISANRQEDDVRRALALGADDYVVKPFNPLTLLARVRRLLA